MASLYLFVFGLQLLAAGAAGISSLLPRTGVEGPPGLLGLGWLGAAAALAGSPVAAISLTLLDGGAIDSREALAMVSGSRFGASFVVLAVGFVSYLSGHRRADGLYVGVVALITTATIYVPATVIGFSIVDSGWLSSLAGSVPALPAAGVRAVFGDLTDALVDTLPAGLIFAAGTGLLLLAFSLFDRALPRLDPPSPRFESLVGRSSGPRVAFVAGGLITAVTMSVAVSVTVLVPLSLKGVVRRDQLIPYIMGANITTFVDTFAAALLLDNPAAPAVVLAQVLSVSVVSLFVLAAVYGPYSTAVHRLAHRMLARRSVLAVSLLGWGAIPVALVLLF